MPLISVEEAVTRLLGGAAALAAETVPLPELPTARWRTQSQRCAPSRPSPPPPWTVMRCEPKRAETPTK